jgi:hypothetical protein
MGNYIDLCATLVKPLFPLCLINQLNTKYHKGHYKGTLRNLGMNLSTG